jgi:hypothetical protein
MNPNTPDERDITKQQLWERDLQFLDLLNQNVSQFSGMLDGASKRLTDTFQDLIKQQTENFQKITDSLDASVSQKKKELEDGVNKVMSDAVLMMNKKIDEINGILQNYSTSIAADTESKLQLFFNDTLKNIHDLDTKMDNTYDILSHDAQSLQHELTSKLGEILQMFTDIKGKFKKISEQLQ